MIYCLFVIENLTAILYYSIERIFSWRKVNLRSGVADISLQEETLVLDAVMLVHCLIPGVTIF